MEMNAPHSFLQMHLHWKVWGLFMGLHLFIFLLKSETEYDPEHVSWTNVFPQAAKKKKIAVALPLLLNVLCVSHGCVRHWKTQGRERYSALKQIPALPVSEGPWGIKAAPVVSLCPFWAPFILNADICFALLAPRPSQQPPKVDNEWKRRQSALAWAE